MRLRGTWTLAAAALLLPACAGPSANPIVHAERPTPSQSATWALVPAPAPDDQAGAEDDLPPIPRPEGEEGIPAVTVVPMPAYLPLNLEPLGEEELAAEDSGTTGEGRVLVEESVEEIVEYVETGSVSTVVLGETPDLHCDFVPGIRRTTSIGSFRWTQAVPHGPPARACPPPAPVCPPAPPPVAPCEPAPVAAPATDRRPGGSVTAPRSADRGGPRNGSGRADPRPVVRSAPPVRMSFPATPVIPVTPSRRGTVVTFDDPEPVPAPAARTERAAPVRVPGVVLGRPAPDAAPNARGAETSRSSDHRADRDDRDRGDDSRETSRHRHPGREERDAPAPPAPAPPARPSPEPDAREERREAREDRQEARREEREERREVREERREDREERHGDGGRGHGNQGGRK